MILAESGIPVTVFCREYFISAALFYKWRAKFGGMDACELLESIHLTVSAADLPQL
ncbi:MAG: hypothetical protein H0T84_12265 [Tatlockia sp.]|nr:hypothetical protein [Tatlockia sp.]